MPAEPASLILLLHLETGWFCHLKKVQSDLSDAQMTHIGMRIFTGQSDPQNLLQIQLIRQQGLGHMTVCFITTWKLPRIGISQWDRSLMPEIWLSAQVQPPGTV